MLTPEYIARIRAQVALTPEQARIGAGMAPRAPVQGSVLGASTSQGGAPFVDDMGIPFRNEDVARNAKYYGQEAANEQTQRDYNAMGFSGSSQNYDTGVDVFTASSIAKQYGLQGVNEKMFVGLSMSEARKKASELQSKRKGQTSALTSSVFNSETTSNFNKKVSDIKLKVDSVNNDPWVNNGQKKDKQSSIVNSFTDQLANLFSSQDEFSQAMENPEFQKTVNRFQQLGGDINSVAMRISKTPTVGVMGQVQNPDGSFSMEDEQMDMNSYLGAMKNPSDQRALDSLIPQKEIFQQQIAYEQSIPDKFRDEYFGTPEKIGFVQQRRQQNEEEIKLLEVRAKSDEKNMRAQASFAIQKNQMELSIEADTIEENRLNAKNYMTGMLAKLGALNTTGAAPQALATLEQKYQVQSQKLRTFYEMANRQIELKLNENVDEINNGMNEDILKVRRDLSKTEEDVWNEIFKLQTDADRKSLSTVEKYTLQFRNQRDKYTKEAKLDAEKNAREYQKLAQKYNANKLAQTLANEDMEGGFVVRKKEKGILKPDGSIKPYNLTPALAQEVKNAQVFGEDAITFFTSTKPEFRDFLVTNDKFRLNKSQLQAEYKKWQADQKKTKNSDDDFFEQFNVKE